MKFKLLHFSLLSVLVMLCGGLAHATDFRNIKIDLTAHSELLTESNVLITVAEDGTIGTTDDAAKAAGTINGKVHGSYGSSNFTASIPVQGCVKITYATHDYGNDIVVTNAEGSEVAKLNTMGAKWMSDHNNVVVAYYRTNEPTTLNFSNANYNPYFAVEAIDPADLPAEVTTYNITFAAGEGEGVAPKDLEVNAGEKFNAPKNYTLYKEGATLTGWSDGTKTYAVGEEITPEADMTLTAQYTANEVTLADRTEAVTITYALDGYNNNPKYNFQNNTGIIVTQTTVNGKTIDVKATVDASSGKFAYNGSGWHQVITGTRVMVPSVKDATIAVTTHNDATSVRFNGKEATADGNTAKYTATDDTQVGISQMSENYWNKLEIVLPKVEQKEPAEFTFRNFEIDPLGDLLTTEEKQQGTELNFGVIVNADGTQTRVAADNAAANVVLSGIYHNDHGWRNFKAVVPVEGSVKITMSTCSWGSDVTVKNAAGTAVAEFTTQKGEGGSGCYSGGKSADVNIVSAEYKGEATTLTISGGGYVNYFAIEAIEGGEEPTESTIFSWEGAAGGDIVSGGTVSAADKDGNDITSSIVNAQNSTFYTIKVDGKKDFTSGNTVTITLDNELKAEDIINITAYRNKNDVDKKTGALMKFEKGGTASTSTTGLEFVNIDTSDASVGDSNRGTEPNTVQVTVPKAAAGSKTITITRAETGTNLWITKLVIEAAASSEDPEEPVESGYTNTWQFGKSNGAPEFALQKSPEYSYKVNDHELIINTDAGKLNNASRSDEWSQCNNGTIIKVPVYAGAKLSWGRYQKGAEAGFIVNDVLFNEYYIATEDGTAELKAQGISYLSYIKIEPVKLYDINGTVTGGTINGSSVILTAAGNAQPYSATIAEGAFAMKVPADTYTPSLSNDVAYIVKSPETIKVSADGSVGEVTIEAAKPQLVKGQITNAPAEAFILTFTGATQKKIVECAANATSYEATLEPDTYTISSSVGTLSTLSKENFKVLKDAVTFNIYYPEANVPAATQQDITVDNTAIVAANVYNKVGDAIAAAKAGNIAKPIITLTSGQTYQEQVIVNIPDVTLKTSGEEKATITFYYGIGYTYYSLDETGQYNKDRAMTRNSILMRDPNRWGATVLVTKEGNNFKAENIIFENSFNQRYTDAEVIDGVRPNGCQSITYDRTKADDASGYKKADAKDGVTERAAALAFENNPKGCQLYNCKLVGSQDTYYTSGTIYHKNCDIVGNTDYIFGGGKVVFDNCNLIIGGYSDKETSAYITAQNGATGDAYIFRDCTVKKGERQYTLANLGRDWGGKNATVYYLNLKNELGNKMQFKWTSMSKDGGISDGTADLHIYDFSPVKNANYSTTGSAGANINGLLSDEKALNLYADVVTFLGFTPERIYEDRLELDESSDYNTCRLAASDNVNRNVTLQKSLKAGQWNSIVLPFNLTPAQTKAIFGEGTKAAMPSATSTTDANLNFTTIEEGEIAAGTAIIINPAKDITTIEVDNVIIASSPTDFAKVENWTIYNLYSWVSDKAGCYVLKNDKLTKLASNDENILAFSSYIVNDNATEAPTFSIDGTTTGIEEITPATTTVDGKVYNLAGQRVNKATKGLYIINGKKVLVK